MTTAVPVSVVVPCYRCAQTIERAVASVAAQTNLPMELILVDDGSADETRAVLHDLLSRYQLGWIKLVLLEQNVGAASARNAGWAVATQPYVAFLDADDAWHPRKIEIQHDFMHANPDVVLCGHEYRILRDSEECLGQVSSESEVSIGPLRLLLSNPFVTPSAMVKSGIDFRFLPGKRYTDDHLLWMEIVLAGMRVVRLSAPLALINKALYGEAGLSSHMWAMEKSELYNYWYLHETRRIGLTATMALVVFSLAKYFRRILVIGVRRAAKFNVEHK